MKNESGDPLYTVGYEYQAIYNYMLSINLGLVQRESTDIAVEKDLTEATVVINGKVLKYKYNSSIDLDDSDNYDLLYKQIAVADEQIEYSLGLYSSDYYYRASIYNSDSEVKDALEAFYTTTLGTSYSSLGESLEIEIYLKYTINVYNESATYNVAVNQIADYYDETFVLITDPDTQSKTYVETLNGTEVNETMNLAEASTVTYYDSSDNATSTSNVSWTNSGTISGSDGVTYNKITTRNASSVLKSGERAEISVTFKVNKHVSDDDDTLYGAISGISDSIDLGAKHNLAEVTSFTSYYSDTSRNRWSISGQVTGRVDEDSAPDNINITDLNEKNWYEDDTDSAPILTIELYDEDREVNGMVWEDAQTSTIEYSQTVGNGVYNSNEGDKVIEGLTTEIVESISIPTGETDESGNAIYKEYDFIWPTESYTISTSEGDKTLEELTGFDSTTNTDSNGEYVFTSVPAGNYKVRFVYGDIEITTGNDGYEEVYNGQDYKSTSYQVGFDNDSDDDGYTDNAWHDLSNEDLETTRVSDARDSEARRLYITSKSEILTYDNTSVLATADDADADHTELFGDYQSAKSDSVVTGDGYYMYAETAKLALDVETTYDDDIWTIEEENGVNNYIKGNITKGGVQSGNNFTYTINNIDAGLEERSQTELTLDKQIKEITLTSNGIVILDAVYDIEYELGDDDTIKSSVKLNESLSTGYDQIASLNRTNSSQGYRYIMAEGRVLQGTTITVQYQLTVFNVGEADTCNQILKDLWTEVNSEGYDVTANTAVNDVLDELTSPYYTADSRLTLDKSSTYQYGTYFGSIYYLGTQGTYSDSTILVESTVHQIIDYVDPDVEFIDTDNISENQSWSTTSIIYLISNGLINPESVIIVKDGEPVYTTNDDGTIDIVTYADRTANEDDGEYYSFISDKLQEYITKDEDGNEIKNNVILNIDNGDGTGEGTNPELVKETVPYTANYNYDEATASITLQVSRYYSSEEDSSDIDNIAEIIKVENTVGRRDIRTIAGNISTYELAEGATGYDETVDIYTIAGEEPDSSATELITLSPPTGLSSTVTLVMQIIAVVAIAGVILAIGIVLIKKKVLK